MIGEFSTGETNQPSEALKRELFELIEINALANEGAWVGLAYGVDIDLLVTEEGERVAAISRPFVKDGRNYIQFTSYTFSEATLEREVEISKDGGDPNPAWVARRDQIEASMQAKIAMLQKEMELSLEDALDLAMRAVDSEIYLGKLPPPFTVGV